MAVLSHYAQFLLNANATIVGGDDIYLGNVGSNSYIAVDYNDDKVLDYVIEVVGVTGNFLGDIVPI